MKLKATLFSLLLVSVTPNVFAADVCANSPGHWSGSMMFKDENICRKYNGCSHFISANITSQGGNMYSMEIMPAIGASGTIPIQCDNGKITSQVLNPDSKASMNCPVDGVCVARYEDERFLVRMEKTDA